MLVNIVHPYTYKLEGSTLIGGPIEAFAERDKKVSYFGNKALSLGAVVLRHDCLDIHAPHKALESSAALLMDPLYHFLFAENIQGVMTTPAGLLLPDKRPEDTSEKAWGQLRKIYSTEEEFIRMAGRHDTVFFIGGALECCVTNAAVNFHKNHGQKSQKIHYIPDLCVSVNSEWLKEVVPELEKREIYPVSYETALSSLLQASACDKSNEQKDEKKSVVSQNKEYQGAQ